MTKFQKQLSEWKEVTGQGLDPERLIVDFPEIFKEDGKFAKTIYDRIYGFMDWDSNVSKLCIVTPEKEVANYYFGFLETKLDLPTYFAMQLIPLYSSYIPNDGKYKREEVLEKALSTLQEILVYLHKYLQLTGDRGFLEPHSLVLAHRGDFSGQAIDKARERMDKTFKIKFPSGRKPTKLDKSGKQAAIGLHKELMEILKPGFDSRSDYTKMKVCEEAVSQYGRELNLRYPIREGQELALKLNKCRKPEAAAVILIAKILSKKDRTIRRYLSGK